MCRNMEAAVNRGGRPRIIPAPAQLARVKALYWDEGQSLKQVARVFGISAPTLRNWMTENGIPVRPSGGQDPHARNTTGLARRNAQRTAEMAPETIERLRAALADLGDRVPPVLAAAARLRIAYPRDSLSELAAREGVTKDVFAGRRRRLLDLTGAGWITARGRVTHPEGAAQAGMRRMVRRRSAFTTVRRRQASARNGVAEAGGHRRTGVPGAEPDSLI